MNRTITIPEWHKLARKGTDLPVRIPLMGGSMFPLVRYNRDYVTIMPVREELCVGDIVLFEDHTRRLYVMHRVWDMKDHMILTWGDNCLQADGWMPEEEILGKAVLIERGRRTIHPDPGKGMKWAKFWHQAGKVYRMIKRVRDGLARRILKLVRLIQGERRESN